MVASENYSAGRSLVMRIDDLPEVEQGDYGWCLYESMFKGDHPRLVWYDDDDCWCSHGLDEKDPSHECPGEIGDPDLPKNSCYLDWGAMVYPTTDITGHYEVAPYGCLRTLPAFITSQYTTSRKQGWVYAVAIVPDVDLRRLKIGYTERPIGGRLASFRTANPTALLIGLWEANRSDEDRAHLLLPGRVGKSEVFQVHDLAEALGAMDKLLAGPEPP